MKRILTTFKREKGDGLFYPSFVCLWRKRLEVLMDGGKTQRAKRDTEIQEIAEGAVLQPHYRRMIPRRGGS